MRILYVTAHYPPDFTSGATLQVRRLATHATSAGHDVVVLSGAIRAGLTDGAVREERLDGVTVRWIGTADRVDQDIDANWVNPAATSAAAALMDRFRPDVVHAHALQTLGAGVLEEASARRIPTFLTMHDLWWWCPRLFLVDRDLRPCAVVTTTSDCECARTAEWRRRRANALAPILDRVDQILVPSSVLRDVVVANGVALERVAVDENDVDPIARPSSSAPAEPGLVRFAYVGGDHPLKGRDVILAAARMLGRRRGWRLTTYGVARPSARRPRRWRRVRFEPPYDPARTADVMAATDVLVIPSIARESYSLAAREALGAGAAVITTDCLGPLEVVLDQVNGLVVPSGDPGALAGAMARLIDEPHLLATLRRAARSSPPSLRNPAEHVASLVERYRRQAALRG